MPLLWFSHNPYLIATSWNVRVQQYSANEIKSTIQVWLLPLAFSLEQRDYYTIATKVLSQHIKSNDVTEKLSQKI